MTRLDLAEVERRVPALDAISARPVREETALLLADAPRYFWTAPASTSGYHNPLCRGRRGLWIHVLMVERVVDRLSDSWVEQDRLSWTEVDLVRSAALLHDLRKNGPPEDPSDSSVSDHDLRAARVVEQESSLPSLVSSSIASHMGPWYDGPEPETAAERLLHTADMIASTEQITPAVLGPLPEELAEVGVEEVRL